MKKIEAAFSAYIANAGRYSEGYDSGGMLRFPTTSEEVQALLKRIGVDGTRYQEVFIPCFADDLLGVCKFLGEFENIDELNHLARLLSELSKDALEKFEAVLDMGDHTSSVADIINLAQNLDCYAFYPDVDTEEAVGRMYVEDFRLLDVPEELEDYFDYEAFGRDMCINENGYFAPGGYVVRNNENFMEHYHGIQDIPPEHRVFAYPKLTIREQMAVYKEVSDKAATGPAKPAPEQDHDNR